MEQVKKIRQRAEIPQADRWATEDLYANDSLWAEDLQKLQQAGSELAGFAGHLCESADKLLEYFTKMEEVDLLADRLGNYAARKNDEDTTVSTYQGMYGQFMSAAIALQSAVSFETPEIMAISDDKLEAFYAEQPKLERYRRYLSNERRLKDHVLSPAEEKLLAAAGEMAHTPGNVFSIPQCGGRTGC